jgi:hypothetical protein
MKKRRLAKPNEIIASNYRKPAIRLCEQYSEVLRLRNEIRRLTAPETKTPLSLQARH